MNFWAMIYNSDVVAHSCYAGVQQVALQYMDNTPEPNQIAKNILYHFGDIYDNLESLYFFFRETPYSPGTTVEEAGKMLGDVVYLSMLIPQPTDASKTLMKMAQVLSKKVLGRVMNKMF